MSTPGTLSSNSGILANKQPGVQLVINLEIWYIKQPSVWLVSSLGTLALK